MRKAHAAPSFLISLWSSPPSLSPSSSSFLPHSSKPPPPPFHSVLQSSSLFLLRSTLDTKAPLEAKHGGRTEQRAKPPLKPRSEAGAVRVRAVMITCCWSECINRVVPYYRFSFIMYLCVCYNRNQRHIPEHTRSTADLHWATKARIPKWPLNHKIPF